MRKNYDACLDGQMILAIAFFKSLNLRIFKMIEKKIGMKKIAFLFVIVIQ